MDVRVRVMDDAERAVVAWWRRGHLSSATMVRYLHWVRRFRAHCRDQNLVETEHLTRAAVQRFTHAYVGARLKGRQLAQSSCNSARNAVHAWACAVRALGTPAPPWRDPQTPAPLPPLLDEFCQFRLIHHGVAKSSLWRDLDTARGFLTLLRRRRKPLRQATLADVDAFVQEVARRVSKCIVVCTCSSLRIFLRFLRTTGKLTRDLAPGVMAPRFSFTERPPRTLRWDEVKRILHAICRTQAPGRRDFAILLLLATYGLGAAEALGLRLENVDWRAGRLRLCRPKTKAAVELPLLPAVAQALTAYLRWERPPAKTTPYFFLRTNMPYELMTSAALRHRIRYYASRAGVSAKVIGAHAFRHAHASRQIDAGANLKVVSEILGHRSCSSTSVYVRVALRRLRTVALPVPR
jgi:integrase/recombinase XerD